MRSASLLLIIALTAGCGASGHDPKATFGNRFNPPALTTLDPSTVPENSTPFVLTVNGNNFTTDAIVFWNRVPHTARFVSPTQLQVPQGVREKTQVLYVLVNRRSEVIRQGIKIQAVLGRVKKLLAQLAD